jgi:hypothetical protein
MVVGVQGRWGGGRLGLDSLTGLVWLGSLLADHRLGVVTGHVVELDTVAIEQQNNNGSASRIQGVTIETILRDSFFLNQIKIKFFFQFVEVLRNLVKAKCRIWI